MVRTELIKFEKKLTTLSLNIKINSSLLLKAMQKSQVLSFR